MALTNAHLATRLPAQDLDRARRWYSEKLGLDPVEERAGGLRYVVADQEFAVYRSAGQGDGSFTQMAFTVSDIEAEVAELSARGVVFERYDLPGLASTNSGLAQIEGNYPSKGTGERAAWFRDSEGNLFGLGEPINPPAPVEPAAGPVEELRVAVTVGDLDQALTFYRDALGLPELESYQDGEARVVVLEAGRATLELFNESQAELIDRVEVGRRVAPKIRLAMQVADSTTLTEHLVEAGADLVAAPVLTPWNHRNARLETPGDLQLTLFTVLEA